MKLTEKGIIYSTGDLDKYKAVIKSDLSMPQKGFILKNLSAREIRWFRMNINKHEYVEVSNPFNVDYIVFKNRKKAI